MSNLDTAYYKQFLDYGQFVAKYRNETLETLINQRDEINKNCLNKNFMYIMAWEKWITGNYCAEETARPTTTQKAEDGTVEENKLDTSFNDFNLWPYYSESTDKRPDRLLKVDFTDFLKFIIGKDAVQNNKAIKKAFNFNLANLKKDKKTKKERLDFYIDMPSDKMTEAVNGVFIDILDALGCIPDQILINKNTDIKFTYQTAKPNLIQEKIEIIKKFGNDNQTESFYLERENLIEDVADRIIKIVQSFTDMYTNIYNIFVTNEASTVDLTNIAQKSGRGSIPIEKSLLLAKPKIKPAFKKSYIVRENNLKPYISIKMTYSTDEGDISVDNFDIPYNNILSLEHNIKDHNISINLIDTTGIIGELLIQKMYVFSQKKTNLRKIETVQPTDSANSTNTQVAQKTPNPNQSYFFMIEYGWSGPESQDDEEFLEENVFVKAASRGFISSISSQFTFKGNEYTLNIKPNDQERINSYMNNTDIMFFPKNDNKFLPISTGLIAMFLVLYDYNVQNVAKKALETFFKQIEDAVLHREVTGGNGTAHKYFLKTDNDKFLSKDANSLRHSNDVDQKTVDEIATSFWGVSKLAETKRPLKDLAFTNENGKMDRLRKATASEKFSLNAWFVGLYLIWKMKMYYKDNASEKFIYVDTTGLYDVFDDKDENQISNEKLSVVMQKFNPLALNKQGITEIKVDNVVEKILETLNKTIKNKKNKFNEYNLENAVDVEPNDDDVNSPVPLTFFTSQIMNIFAEIKNIGLDCDDNNNNTFHGADGVFADFNTLDTNVNVKKHVINEYKRRIYSDKDNIYSKEKDREDIHSKKFKEFLAKINEDKELEKKKKKQNKDYKTPNMTYHILYLSYKTNPNKVAFLNCSLDKKLNLIGKQMVQSYSFTPRIYPKTRNANRQFFSQGNSSITNEGTGDIIEFSIDPIDIGNFNSIMLSNKNKNNVGFNSFSSSSNVSGIYENAARYYKTYRDLGGGTSINGIAQDMARLDLNYQSQTNIKGSITIPGEPYWSNINLIFSKCIYIHVYYANGNRSSHSGLYYVSNAIQNISDGKFTTKLEIIRAPTFLSSLEKLGNKNKYMS